MTHNDYVSTIQRSAEIIDSAAEIAETAAGILFIEGIDALARKYPTRRVEGSVGMGSLSVTVERRPAHMREYWVTMDYPDELPTGRLEFLAELQELEALFGNRYNNSPMVPDMHVVRNEHD